MENDNNLVGNMSTVVKYISMLIAGYLISLLASQGLNLNISETMLSEVITSIIFLILAHIDATHPNTFKTLGNSPAQKETEWSEPLNPEYTSDENDSC